MAKNKKLLNETGLLREGIRIGMRYAEKRGVVEFEDEEVEGAIRDLEVYGDAQDPAHPANQPLVGSADSGNLTSFEPAGPKAEVTSAEVTAAAAAAAVEAR